MTPEVAIALSSFIFGVIIAAVGGAVRLTFTLSNYVTREEVERYIDRVVDSLAQIIDERLANIERRLDKVEERE